MMRLASFFRSYKVLALVADVLDEARKASADDAELAADSVLFTANLIRAELRSKYGKA